MITPEEIRAGYITALDTVGEDITIRLYAGTGDARAVLSNTTTRGRAVDKNDQPLVGPITQGEFKLIVLAAPLAGIALTTGANCKAVMGGKEFQIKAIDDRTRRMAGEVIAYELTVGG